MKFLTTLIRPPGIELTKEMGLFAVPPLGVAYLAGNVLSKGFPCQVVDSIGEGIHSVVYVKPEEGQPGYYSHGLPIDEIVKRIDTNSKVIGISCNYTKEWLSYKRLIKKIRKHFPQAIIIVGGEHATAVPEICLSEAPEIDLLVMGEGELIFNEILKAIDKNDPTDNIPGTAFLRNGEVVILERQARAKNIDEISWPAWHLIPLENYFYNRRGFGVDRGRSIPVMASRGCPYQCTFCSSPNMWTTRWVARDPDDLLEEMQLYINKHDVQNFDFFDLTAIVNKQWMMEFTTKLIQKNWNITWQLPSGTRVEAIDYNLCKNLYDSGCRNISFSPESGSPRTLKLIKKRMKIDKMCEAIVNSRRAGLNIKANLIIGFPEEHHWDAIQSVMFGLRMAWHGCHDLSIWSFAPYPGTELYHKVRESGKISDIDLNYMESVTYSQIFQNTTFNDNMSVRWINFYRVAGMLLFYIVAFIRDPFRIFKTFNNVFKHKHESRLERVISEKLKNLGLLKS